MQTEKVHLITNLLLLTNVGATDSHPPSQDKIGNSKICCEKENERWLSELNRKGEKDSITPNQLHLSSAIAPVQPTKEDLDDTSSCHFIVSYTKQSEGNLKTHTTQPFTQVQLQYFLKIASKDLLVSGITRTRQIHPVVEKELMVTSFSPRRTDRNLASISPKDSTPSRHISSKEEQETIELETSQKGYFSQLMDWTKSLFSTDRPIPDAYLKQGTTRV